MGVYRTNRIVLQHRQRTMRAWADQGLVVAGHGHGDEAHGYGAGLDCVRGQRLVLGKVCAFEFIAFHSGCSRCSSLECELRSKDRSAVGLQCRAN